MINYRKFLSEKYTINSLLYILPTILTCLCVVRNQHEFFSLPYTIMLLLLLLWGFFWRNRFNLYYLKENIPFFITLFLCFMLQFINNKDYFDSIEAVKGILIYIITICVCSFFINKRYYLYYWEIINFFSLMGSICIILQATLFKIGIRLDNIQVFKETLFNAWEFDRSFRPCGLFSEPSHFAELATISLFYYLFIKRSEKKLIVISLGLIMSTSMLGIMSIPILLGIYILTLKKATFIHKLFIGIITLVLLMGIYYYFIADYSWLNERIFLGGTFGNRTLRSIEIFNRLDFWESLYGIGLQNQTFFLNYMGIILESDAFDTLENREYAQTLGYILCTNGIIGFVVFYMQFILIWKKSELTTKVFLIWFSIILSTCCILTRPIFVIYLVTLGNLYYVKRSGLNYDEI